MKIVILAEKRRRHTIWEKMEIFRIFSSSIYLPNNTRAKKSQRLFYLYT